jgi:hypothetical protein
MTLDHVPSPEQYPHVFEGDAENEVNIQACLAMEFADHAVLKGEASGGYVTEG